MKLQLTFIFIIISFLLSAQNREHAFEVNQRLGRGINYGNMFEAPSENEWGNPWKPEYAKIISDLGFNHIRIPIRWETRTSANSPYTINTAFLNRIKQVVDSALNSGLHAIINMHHHDALFDNPDAQKARFLAQWKQISEFFKDYPDSLVFEILNEPHGNMDADKWNNFLAEALDTIRVDNPDRIVLVAPAEWGGLGGLPTLQLPDDENIILTVHYYNPFQFTHQGAEWVDGADAWLGTEWNDSETERMVVEQEFAPLVAFEKAHHVPVHIGEFGAYSKADMFYRKKWTTYISRYLETLNWSWAYWEFSAGFGIYNPSTKVLNEDLVDALLHSEMPEPARYVGTIIYKSNFSTSTDGWARYQQGSASSTLTRSNNMLTLSISNGGTEGWHVQLVKNNLQLKAGKKYRYSFKAKGEASRSFTSYIGMNHDPWSAYSGYNGGTLSDTFQVFTYVFDQAVNDNLARVCFDLGKSDVDFELSEFLLEEIVLVPPTKAEDINEYQTSIYPNPTSGKLYIDNLDEFNQYTIFDLRGQELRTENLNHYKNTIDLSDFLPGLYFIRLTDNGKSHVVKIQKH